MERYINIINFYKINEQALLFGKKSIKPAQSITRNIFSSFERFYNYHKLKKQDSYSFDELAEYVWPTKEGSKSITTTSDNIRNMTELKFWEKRGDQYVLTRNFIDFMESEQSLQKYIINLLAHIHNLSDMSMFLNYILCVLREGIIYGKIVNYPGNTKEFKDAIPDKQVREQICKKVYDLYGFHGLNNNDFGEYTPKIIYRIISTCVSLGLVAKDGKDEYNFATYRITQTGYQLLDVINKNVGPNLITNDELKKDLEKLDDINYQLESENLIPSKNLGSVDKPCVLQNNLTLSSKVNRIKRDPQKASNAKKLAKYKCEANKEHFTFMGLHKLVYTEAHHLIPMSKQKDFKYSLDVEANIVSLCPLCHSRLHHAIFDDKKELLTKLYNDRKERLSKCNIELSLEQLLNYYHTRN